MKKITQKLIYAAHKIIPYQTNRIFKTCPPPNIVSLINERRKIRKEVVNIEPRSLPTSSTLISIASSTNELADTSTYTTVSIDSVHMIAELCNSILNIDCTQRSLSVLIYAILKHFNVPDRDADSFLSDITLNSAKTCKLHYDTFVADNDDMILNDGRGGKHEPTMPTLLVKGKCLGKYIHLPTKLGSLFCEKKGIKVKKKQNNKI
ncbi:hypothetical protein BpHYR1_052563 [Brachionus plicatilis]|uniref:Uncharacterized protein n=1 Tax=Brachionus plicatilis TaxID=10195 RepID=A0A3M7P909_BRAPC|nr:hypothetical protein BpHYR1_052563 [Brachionus plicatilis]